MKKLDICISLQILPDMNIHFIQHVPYEGLGYIEEWINQKGHQLTSTKVFEKAEFPDINSVDFIIIMGGPMSTYEEDKYSWLKPEKAFIKKAIENDKIVLGVCLGSQLIANVLGARVYTNTEKEIGWFDVAFEESFSSIVIKYSAKKITTFHWHGDTFDIPEGATNHASSKACKHQLFTYGKKVMGIQFHPEVTPNVLRAISNADEWELKLTSKYIQSKEEITSAVQNIEGSNLLMENILDELSSQG